MNLYLGRPAAAERVVIAVKQANSLKAFTNRLRLEVELPGATAGRGT